MKTMASSICHRGYEIRVRCTEGELYWVIDELLVLRGNRRISASDFNLLPHYVSGDAAVQSGYAEGRRLIDEDLAGASRRGA